MSFKRLFVFIIAMVLNSGAWASVGLSTSRVIYAGEESSASLKVNNTETRAYLIQAWVDQGTEKNTQSKVFVVTPPVFRLNGKGQNIIQIIYTGAGLSTTQESLMWVNVKAIPAMTDQEHSAKNKVIMAVNSRVKLFYRPQGLAGTATESIGKLSWSVNDSHTVIANNTTPYYVVLNRIQVDDESVPVVVETNNTVIAPGSSKSFVVKKTLGSKTMIKWSGINDYGVESTLYAHSF